VRITGQNRTGGSEVHRPSKACYARLRRK
jgi:hypothetical protein